MDGAILQGIQETLRTPLLDAVLPYFTHLGQVGALWLIVGFALVISKKYRSWGIALLAAVAAVGLFNEVILKAIVARPRPFVDDPTIALLVSPPSGFSFPSGHAGTSFAAATVIAFMPIKKGWKALAWVVAVLLAFSRLYLQVHYPTDVLAGAVFGLVYGFIAVGVRNLVVNKRQLREVGIARGGGSREMRGRHAASGAGVGLPVDESRQDPEPPEASREGSQAPGLEATAPAVCQVARSLDDSKVPAE